MKSPHHLVVFCGAVLAVAMVGDPARGQAAARRPATRQRPPRRRAARPQRPPRPSRPIAGWPRGSSRTSTPTANKMNRSACTTPSSCWRWTTTSTGPRKSTFRHDVWALDFKFKPVRMMWVDVPQAQRQNAAEIDLVHGLFGDQSRQDDASGRASPTAPTRSNSSTSPSASFRSSAWRSIAGWTKTRRKTCSSRRSMSIA